MYNSVINQQGISKLALPCAGDCWPARSCRIRNLGWAWQRPPWFWLWCIQGCLTPSGLGFMGTLYSTIYKHSKEILKVAILLIDFGCLFWTDCKSASHPFSFLLYCPMCGTCFIRNVSLPNGWSWWAVGLHADMQSRTRVEPMAPPNTEPTSCSETRVGPEVKRWRN